MKKIIFTLLLVWMTGMAATSYAMQLWPIFLDDITASKNENYIVADFREDNETKHFWIWNNYLGNFVSGLNFYKTGNNYLSLVIGNDSWAGCGFHVENATSIQAAESLRQQIKNNPNNYYLHLAIKSTDNASHTFCIFGEQNISFVLGNSAVNDNTNYGNFPRDGMWYDFFVPMSDFANALAQTSPFSLEGSIIVLSIISEAIEGAQLNIDAIYFCDSSMKDLMDPYCGICGDSLTWKYNDGVLTIEGTGDMYDYILNSSPWSNLSLADSIKTIILPQGLMSIGYAAFSNCSSLTSITIPNSVTSIGDEAFSNCSSLTSFTIPDGVTSIGAEAFYNCSSLTSINIPNSVTYIGDIAFSRCGSLPIIDNIRYADTYLIEAIDKTLSSYTIREETRWIGDVAFNNCKNLKSVTIPNSVTNIGEEAFSYCSSLTSITIPEGVTSIGTDAFYDVLNIVYHGTATGSPWGAKYMNCYVDNIFIYTDSTKSILKGCITSATNIVIPQSVTSISTSAFNDCSNLTSITLESEKPISISYNLGLSKNCIVYVPYGLLNAYKSQYSLNFHVINPTHVTASVGATSTTITVGNSEEAKHIASCGVEEGEENEGNILEFIGLEPDSEYKDVSFKVTTNEGDNEVLSCSFTTLALELTTQPSKAVSSTTAILLAETNMSDVEMGAGFEWKRNDAPDDMAGTKVYCPVANGTDGRQVEEP